MKLQDMTENNDTNETTKWQTTSKYSQRDITKHLSVKMSADRLDDRDKEVKSRIVLFTNPSARAGYDTRSIFKRSLTGLNSEFSFS